MNDKEFASFSIEYFDKTCEALKKPILDQAKNCKFKLNKTQECILHFEIASLIAYFDYIVINNIHPWDDQSIEAFAHLFAKAAIKNCSKVSRPLFSNIPTAKDFVIQRFADYSYAAFNDYYISQNLQYYLSDDQVQDLIERPVNQLLAAFCEFVSRLTIKNLNTPVKYDPDVTSLTLSGLQYGLAIGAFSVIVHDICGAFLNMVLKKTFIVTDERLELFKEPSFKHSST